MLCMSSRLFIATMWSPDLLALVCDVYCDFVTFSFGILGQVWYLIVSIPDPCCLSYFHKKTNHEITRIDKLTPSFTAACILNEHVSFHMPTRGRSFSFQISSLILLYSRCGRESWFVFMLSFGYKCSATLLGGDVGWPVVCIIAVQPR